MSCSGLTARRRQVACLLHFLPTTGSTGHKCLACLYAPQCTWSQYRLHMYMYRQHLCRLSVPCVAVRSLVADLVDTLAATGGNALKLVHTHDGAAAAAMALAYGTPKDRKRLVKGMKGGPPLRDIISELQSTWRRVWLAWTAADWFFKHEACLSVCSSAVYLWRIVLLLLLWWWWWCQYCSRGLACAAWAAASACLQPCTPACSIIRTCHLKVAVKCDPQLGCADYAACSAEARQRVRSHSSDLHAV